MYDLATDERHTKTKKIGEFLVKYQKHIEFFCEKSVLWLLTLQGFKF